MRQLPELIESLLSLFSFSSPSLLRRTRSLRLSHDHGSLSLLFFLGFRFLLHFFYFPPHVYPVVLLVLYSATAAIGSVSRSLAFLTLGQGNESPYNIFHCPMHESCPSVRDAPPSLSHVSHSHFWVLEPLMSDLVLSAACSPPSSSMGVQQDTAPPPYTSSPSSSSSPPFLSPNSFTFSSSSGSSNGSSRGSGSVQFSFSSSSTSFTMLSVSATSSRRSFEWEQRPLPPGWVREFDQK